MRVLLLLLAWSSVPLGALAAQACPAVFEEFLGAFESSVDFQRAHTRFPLTYSHLDKGANPEPKTVLETIGNQHVATFVRIAYPSREKQATVPFERRVSSPQADVRRVRLAKPDTDYVLEYTFAKAASCWELTRVDDVSL